MTYQLITEYNLTAGLHILPVYINDISGGLFIKLVLLSVWILCSIGSYFIQKKVNAGASDFPSCIAVGGFITIISAVILRFIPGLVDSLTLIVTIIIGAISVLWFLFTENNQ